MTRWAALLFLAGCATEALPEPPPAPPPPSIPASLTRCPQGVAGPAVPPPPRTPEQIARFAIGTERARMLTERARAECERRLRAVVEIARD